MQLRFTLCTLTPEPLFSTITTGGDFKERCKQRLRELMQIKCIHALDANVLKNVLEGHLLLYETGHFHDLHSLTPNQPLLRHFSKLTFKHYCLPRSWNSCLSSTPFHSPTIWFDQISQEILHFRIRGTQRTELKLQELYACFHSLLNSQHPTRSLGIQ